MMLLRSLCLVAIGLDGIGTLALPNPSTTTGPDARCDEIECATNQLPVWNPSSNGCNCAWITPTSSSPSTPVDIEERDVTLPDPADPRCTDVICVDEKEPVYNITSQECECQWRPGLEPSPRLCPDTICISEMQPVYNMSSRRCYCDWLPAFEEKREEVAAPSTTEQTTVEAVPTPPTSKSSLESCAGIYCPQGQRATPDSLSNGCSCGSLPNKERDKDIPDPKGPTTSFLMPRMADSLPACWNITCPDPRQQPSWYPTLPHCVCLTTTTTTTSTTSTVPTAPLPPTTTLKTSITTPPSVPPSRTSVPEGCRYIACIAEMRPTWIEEEQRCVCEWISGLGPPTAAATA